MGHCIQVYLMRKSELRNEKIDSIVDDKLIHQKIVWTELKEGILATTDIPNIDEYKKDKTVAFITTDYFGGPGTQTAKLFVNGVKEYDINSEYDRILFHGYSIDDPINQVLIKMGVTRKSGGEPWNDEFDAIGLGSYRSNEDFNR
jgi:hypothetical protein